jgi:hypothetical protein
MQWNDEQFNTWVQNGSDINVARNVTELRLSNQLTELPESIGNLTNLEELNLSNNQLTALPESIGNLTNLRTLNLGFNQLTTIPVSIGNLTNLGTLNLGFNQFTALPESIGDLTNLVELNLTENQLTELPESIGNLTNLITLYLGYNQLTALPESIGNLTNLEQLILTENQLTELPESIDNLPNLEELDFTDNPLDDTENNMIDDDRPNTAPAFHVHNNYNKISIGGVIQFLEENIKGDIPRFEDMLDVPFIGFIHEYFNHFLESFTRDDLIENLKGVPENVTSWRDVWDRLSANRSFRGLCESMTPEEKRVIGLVILYTSEQTDPFKKYYVISYLEDVINAYNPGQDPRWESKFSCVKGMRERLVTSLKTAIEYYQTLPVDTTQDKKEEYNIIKSLLTGLNTEAASSIIKRWVNEHQEKSRISAMADYEQRAQEINKAKEELLQEMSQELGYTREQILEDRIIREMIEYTFSDQNVDDYSFGGSKGKKSRRRKGKKSQTRKGKQSQTRKGKQSRRRKGKGKQSRRRKGK